MMCPPQTELKEKCIGLVERNKEMAERVEERKM